MLADEPRLAAALKLAARRATGVRLSRLLLPLVDPLPQFLADDPQVRNRDAEPFGLGHVDLPLLPALVHPAGFAVDRDAPVQVTA